MLKSQQMLTRDQIIAKLQASKNVKPVEVPVDLTHKFIKNIREVPMPMLEVTDLVGASADDNDTVVVMSDYFMNQDPPMCLISYVSGHNNVYTFFVKEFPEDDNA